MGDGGVGMVRGRRAIEALINYRGDELWLAHYTADSTMAVTK
jgi:hypothetical protein